MEQDLKLLAQFSQVFRSLMDTCAEQISLHRAQASVLSALFRQDAQTQSELAEQLCVQGATITNMLQRMEEAGLIIRQRDPQDNRLVRVYLTEAGQQQEQVIREQFTRLEVALFDGFKEEDRVALRHLLVRLMETMQKLSA